MHRSQSHNLGPHNLFCLRQSQGHGDVRMSMTDLGMRVIQQIVVNFNWHHNAMTNNRATIHVKLPWRERIYMYSVSFYHRSSTFDAPLWDIRAAYDLERDIPRFPTGISLFGNRESQITRVYIVACLWKELRSLEAYLIYQWPLFMKGFI